MRIDSDKDESDLVDSRYNVDKSRLGTAANEFVGRLQAEEARIDLGVAEQKLKVTEASMASHRRHQRVANGVADSPARPGQIRRRGYQDPYGADGNQGASGGRGGVRF